MLLYLFAKKKKQEKERETNDNVYFLRRSELTRSRVTELRKMYRGTSRHCFARFRLSNRPTINR